MPFLCTGLSLTSSQWLPESTIWLPGPHQHPPDQGHTSQKAGEQMAHDHETCRSCHIPGQITSTAASQDQQTRREVTEAPGAACCAPRLPGHFARKKQKKILHQWLLQVSACNRTPLLTCCVFPVFFSHVYIHCALLPAWAKCLWSVNEHEGGSQRRQAARQGLATCGRRQQARAGLHRGEQRASQAGRCAGWGSAETGADRHNSSPSPT